MTMSFLKIINIKISYPRSVFQAGIVALVVFFNTVSIARQVIELPIANIIVRSGEVSRVPLDARYFVHRLFIEAVSANTQDSMGEVRVKNETKGTIYVPGHDPTYVVTLAEETDSFEIWGTQNALKIIKIKAEVSQIQDPHYPGETVGRLDVISTRVIELCRYLELKIHPGEYQEHFNPINHAASVARAYANARGDLSEIVQEKFKILIFQIESVERRQELLDRLFKNPETQMQIIEILSLKERLRKLFF